MTVKSWRNLEATCHTTFVDCQVVVVKQPEHEVKVLTHVTISRGALILTTATLIGEYNQAQAMSEYLKLIDGELNKEAMKVWNLETLDKVPGSLATETYSGIWLGDVLVADSTMTGHYTPTQALEDFEINQKEWNIKKLGQEMAKSLGLLNKKKVVEEIVV